MTRAILPALLAGLILTPATVDAQRRGSDRYRRYVRSANAVELGLIGGPNRNTVTGAGLVDAKYRGSLGAFLSVPVMGSIRLRPEVAVSGKQVGVTDQVIPPCLPDVLCDPISERQTASFTWLEAPLLIEARLDRALGGWGTPRIYGGPFVAVRLSCSFATPIEVTPEPLSDREAPRIVRPCNPTDGTSARYNNGDAGFVVGGTIAAGSVGVGVRWTRSLVPIAPDQSVLGGGRLIGAKHSTLAVTLEFATKLR
ncbi:MAG: hypothetical protein AB7R55_13225 [Gemmatimonadales bacterium]